MKSYKELSEELDKVLLKLQQSEIDVDEAVKLYESGLELVDELEKYLKETENKLSIIKSKNLIGQD